MGKNLVPQLRVRLTQEQHQWFIEYLSRTDNNANALLRELVQERMIEDKNYRGQNND